MTHLRTDWHLDQLPVGTIIEARAADGRPWEEVTGKPWRARCIHPADALYSLWVVDGAPDPFPEWSYSLIHRAGLHGVHHWAVVDG